MTENVKHTIHLFSNWLSVCELCSDGIHGGKDGEDLSDSINHYIQKHGYRLLYVGGHTYEGEEGKWNMDGTTAILGSDIVPEPKNMKSIKEILDEAMNKE